MTGILIPQAPRKTPRRPRESKLNFASLLDAVDTKRESLMRDALKEAGSRETPQATLEIQEAEKRFVLAALAGKVVRYDDTLAINSWRIKYRDALAKKLAGPDGDYYEYKSRANNIIESVHTFIDPDRRSDLSLPYDHVLAQVDEAREALFGRDPIKNTDAIKAVRMAEIPYLLGVLADRVVTRSEKDKKDDRDGYINALAARMQERAHNREEKDHEGENYRQRAEAKFRQIEALVETLVSPRDQGPAR